MTILNYIRSHGLWNGTANGYYTGINYYIGDDDGSNNRERAVFEFDIPDDLDDSQPVYFNFEILSKFGSGSPVARRWDTAYPTNQTELGASGFLSDLPTLPTTNQVFFSDSVGVKSIDVLNLLLDAISAGQPKFILALDDYNNYDDRYYRIDNTSNIPTLSYTALVSENNTSTVVFDHYFDFYNLSPYSRCENNLCIEQVFPSGESGGNYENLSPSILNIFSSNLNRNNYGENNFVSLNNSRLKIVSGFDLSSDFTLAIHAFTSGTDTTVFDNASGIFRVTNSNFYSQSNSDTWSRPIPNSSNEVDVLIRRLNDSYRVYGLTEGIDDYVDFTPSSIKTPTTNETILLPFVSGNLCEVLYSSSGWSDSDIALLFDARYSLQSHILQTSGYIQSTVPYSSGYNEIELNIVPTYSIKEIDPFYQSLNLPARIDYNSVQNNSGFYLNLDYTSDMNFAYSGQFLYTNGYINFLSHLSSGTDVQVSIPVVDANNNSLDGFDDIVFNSKIVLGQNGSPYSGVIKFKSLDINLNAYDAVLQSSKALDMFLETTKVEENSFDFYVDGHSTLFSGVDFYTSGINVEDRSLDFYINNNLSVNNSLNFYLPNTFISAGNVEMFMSGTDREENNYINFLTSGVFKDQNSLEMFISGVGSTNSSLNLFTYNSEYGLNIAESGNIPEDFSSGHINNSFRMFIGGDNYDNSINLFINSIGSSGTAVNMFIGGENKNSENYVDFLVWNNSSGVEEGIEFFTKSSIVTNSNLNMFIGREYEAVEYNLPFFVKSNEGTYSGIDFVTEGSYLEYNTIDLTVSGSHSPNKSINLYSHGF